MGESIGILSLKGGVGKTSTVAALGAAMADFGKKTLLVDGNFSAPNLGLHFNIVDPDVTVHHVLAGKANVEDAIYNLDNFDLIPASIFNSSVINPLKLRDKLRPLRKKYDFIFIDSSPALNDETLGAMLASDKLLVVTTPDLPTLSTTIKAVKLAKQRNTPVVGLIVNKTFGKDFEVPLSDIERTAHVPVLAVIPHDINVMKAQAKALPSTVFKPRSEGSIEYKKLAATLAGEKYNPFTLRRFMRLHPHRADVNRDKFYDSVFGN